MINYIRHTTVLLLLIWSNAVWAIETVPTEKLTSKRAHSLSKLTWKLWGYTPEGWRNNFDFNNISGTFAEYRNIPVTVPGSVNLALKNAGIIDDWNIGLNSLKSEWISNRSWIYTTTIPDEWLVQADILRLKFLGLDGNGTIWINGKEVAQFDNAFISYNIDIQHALTTRNNKLAIVFGIPPAYIGQVYWTSKIKDWKPRFNYGWDWMPRIVQIGVWDDILLEVLPKEAPEIIDLKMTSTAAAAQDLGTLNLSINGNDILFDNYQIEVELKDEKGKILIREHAPATAFKDKTWSGLKIKRWWPNGLGSQHLYTIRCRVINDKGNVVEEIDRKIGFKHIAWLPAKNASPDADPWICSINNVPVFLQGVNWTPILPNFADLNEEHYRKLFVLYQDLGINTLRVWGGGFPEKDWFYDMCDEYGFFIQQDFPLSSSGLDNYPPTSDAEISAIETIAKHYIQRIRHHVSLLMWCGGNELYEYGDQQPVNVKHPMIAKLAHLLAEEDPTRRFVAGSPSGKNISVTLENIGSGDNWDTHGPWGLPFSTTDRSMEEVKQFWLKADALMFSEVGVPGAMSVPMINKYRGDLPAFPATYDNLLWNRVNWWNEWSDYLIFKKGDNNIDLEDYVAWSQLRQTEGLCLALSITKAKFPEVGGLLLWMGHDSFPCLSNNSIIDFDGNLKPAAIELKRIWKTDPKDLKANLR